MRWTKKVERDITFKEQIDTETDREIDAFSKEEALRYPDVSVSQNARGPTEEL